jgi:DNA-binding CsgD family transcriptional regulator
VEEAELLARESNDARLCAIVLLTVGHVAIWRSEWDLANACLADAYGRLRDLGELPYALGALFLLGWVATLQGVHKTAESRFAQALALAQSAGFQNETAWGFEASGNSAREQGDYSRAASLVGNALSIVQDGSDLGSLANCFKTLGAVAAATGNGEQGTRLFGAAEALRDRMGIGLQPEAENIRLEEAYAPARAKLSDEDFAAAWSTGRMLPLDQATAEAFDVVRRFSSVETDGDKSTTRLTRRELDVLRLIVEGLSDKEIAETLGISRRTASKHVETILSKLDVPSRTAAATYATRHGLV